MSLQYCRCESYYLDNFSYGQEYIRYSDSETDKVGIYINASKQLESVEDYKFTKTQLIHHVKKVVAIYTNDHLPIIVGKTYCVYKTDNKKYQILSENLKLEMVKSDYFIEESQYNSLNKDAFKLFVKSKAEEFDKDIISLREQANEAALQKEKEEKTKNKLKILDSICKTIAEYGTVSKTRIIESCPKKIRIGYALFSLLSTILSTYLVFLTPSVDLNVVLLLISSALFIFSLVALAKVDYEVINEEYDIDIVKYEQLKFMNHLPLELLGKIKQVENELVILNYMKVDDEVIRLFQESLNLTLYVSTNEDYYLSNKETIDKKLMEFLDTTMEYIETLKNNRKVEKSYISTNVAKSIVTMIDENNALFKSMIEDNHYLTDIFKENEEE